MIESFFMGLDGPATRGEVMSRGVVPGHPTLILAKWATLASVPVIAPPGPASPVVWQWCC